MFDRESHVVHNIFFPGVFLLKIKYLYNNSSVANKHKVPNKSEGRIFFFAEINERVGSHNRVSWKVLEVLICIESRKMSQILAF